MIPLLLSFVLASFLAIVLVWKFLKANDLIPSSLNEWRQRKVIEGTTEFVWSQIPSLWVRLSIVIFMIVFLIVWIFSTSFPWSESISRIIKFSFYFVWVILVAIITQLLPRSYRITNLGIWSKTVYLFGNPEHSGRSEKRLFWWKDIETIKVQQGKIIIYPRISEHRSFWRLPSWMLKEVKKIDLPLVKANPNLEARIKSFMNYSSEKT